MPTKQLYHKCIKKSRVFLEKVYYIFITKWQTWVESLNSALRRLNSQRSVFPSDTALLKALYPATFETTKKWIMPLRNWGKVYGELSIMYEGRLG